MEQGAVPHSSPGGCFNYCIYIKRNLGKLDIRFFGVIFTIFIFGLIYKDELDRDVNLKLMDDMEKYVIPADIRKDLKKKGYSSPFIRISGEPPHKWRFVRGRKIIRAAIFSFIAIDIIFSVIINLFPKNLP
jgi:hypothetical protein